MLIYSLLGHVGMPVRIRAVLSEIMIVMYGFMVGFPASAFRAICMFTIFLAAKAVKRTYDMLTAMSLALTLVSVMEPKMLADTGLQLSYLAVIGVGYFGAAYSANAPKHEKKNRDGALGKISRAMTKRAADALKISLFVFLSTLPAVLKAYGEAAFLSVLLNIAIIPFMSLLLSASVVLVLLGGTGLPHIPQIPAWIIKVILGLYKWLCTLLDTHGMGRINVGSPGPLKTVIYYVLIVIAVNIPGTVRGLRGRRRIVTLLLLVLAVSVLFIHPVRGLNIWALDVGQGDCMVLNVSNRFFDEGKIYVIDCGSSSEKAVGERRLVPMLKYYGFDRVDGLIISHPDSDHYNGIEELLAVASRENLMIGKIYVYEGFLEHENLKTISEDHELTGLHEGMRISDGDLDIDVLYPYKGCSPEDTNEASLIMDISYRDFHMITTGDATEASEGHISADQLSDSGYSLLKVAHHGSSSSSGIRFLDLIRPTVAVISCGRDNPYGHPHKETLKRLTDTGSRIYRTDRDGAVIMHTDGRKLKISTYIRNRQKQAG